MREISTSERVHSSVYRDCDAFVADAVVVRW